MKHHRRIKTHRPARCPHARLGRLAARWLAALLAVCLLAGCAAPVAPGDPSSAGDSAGQPAVPATLAEYPLVLPWYRGEGYNPYLTNNALTVQLADLLFEKLVVIDPAGDLEYRVVRAVRVEGLTVTLTVDASYCYADGTAVSAADVAACLQAARSSRLYRDRFANVERIEAAEGLVTLTLQRPDVYFAWLLDIPVMPAAETGAEKPTASGRYTYADDGDALAPNPAAAVAAPVQRIELCEMTGADALANSLNIGAISLYASESEGLANGINSSRQAQYYTNTLVFVGFNAVTWSRWKTTDADGVESWHSQATGAHPLLETAAGRRAVASLFDRTALLERVYYNRGHVATGFLDTIGAAGGAGTLPAVADSSALDSQLAALNYHKDLDGYYHLQKDGKLQEAVPLRLVVYTGSSYKRYLGQLVADALTAAGLPVETVACDTLEDYLQRIATLQFDMYIGEIKLYNNMDLGAFFDEQGAAAAGLQLPEELQTLYEAWRADAGGLGALEAALAAEMPWAPLLWRSGVLYYAKALEGFTPAAGSLFYGFENIYLAE